MNANPSTVVEFNGQSKSVKEWAYELGVNAHSIAGRLTRGWPADKALTTPVRAYNRKPKAVEDVAVNVEA